MIAIAAALMTWGAVRSQVGQNKSDIARIREEWDGFQGMPRGDPAYVTPAFCKKQHEIEGKRLASISVSLKGLKNGLSYLLIKREGMDALEVKQLLNGGEDEGGSL